MKEVLLTVKPEWCKKIFNGEKTIEVRKTCPKLEPPFKVLVYCTKAKHIPEDGLYFLPNDKQLYLGCKKKDLGFVCWEGDFRNGKVIGSFVCDKITRYESEFWDYNTYERIQEPWEPLDFEEYGEYEYDTIGLNGEFCGAGLVLSKQSCLSWNELRNYVGQGLKDFYGWHITEPKLFDNPKELRTLYASCKKDKQTADENCKGCSYAYKGVTTGEIYCDNALTRPPLSWCYVEGI